MEDKTILLVEDNPSDVKLTQRALAKGHLLNELAVARDGQEALDYLFAASESAVPPALILLDLKLPKVDGIAVLRRIKADARTRMIPVVVLTTSNEEQDLKACYELGANSYIRKPVDFNQFVDAVTQVGMYWLVLNETPPVSR